MYMTRNNFTLFQPRFARASQRDQGRARREQNRARRDTTYEIELVDASIRERLDHARQGGVGLVETVLQNCARRT